MNFNETIKLAIAAIWAHKLRSFLTLLGMIIGVTAFMVVLSLLQGFNSYVDEKFSNMKKCGLIILILFSLYFLPVTSVQAQCSICTKTAQQLGERPAKALNGGILYLAAMPFLIFSYIGYRWWKTNR